MRALRFLADVHEIVSGQELAARARRAGERFPSLQLNVYPSGWPVTVIEAGARTLVGS